MNPEKYKKLVNENSPPRPMVKNALWAFVSGGFICLLGQIVLNFAQVWESTETEAAAVTLAIMILLGSLLTGFGFYDEIAEKAGAGASVPITGFANTMTAAAMEFRREGFLLGTASKMFVIAGPVIVYGILSGFIVALCRTLLLRLF